MTPPTLPGEVWRGDIDGPVCVTLDDDAGGAVPDHVALWWDEDDDTWNIADAFASAIFTAWALSLRADAQRAAERMREACAAHVVILGYPRSIEVATAIRALPLPDEVAKMAAREAASLHVPGCARVEAEGVGHPGACVEPTAANDRGKP